MVLINDILFFYSMLQVTHKCLITSVIYSSVTSVSFLSTLVRWSGRCQTFPRRYSLLYSSASSPTQSPLPSDTLHSVRTSIRMFCSPTIQRPMFWSLLLELRSRCTRHIRYFSLLAGNGFLFYRVKLILVQGRGIYVAPLLWLFQCGLVRMWICQNVDLSECRFVRIFECGFVRIFECGFVRLFECGFVRLFECRFIRMFECGSECLNVHLSDAACRLPDLAVFVTRWLCWV